MSGTESGFELVEHTADTAIHGWGHDLPDLFRAMARGLMSVIADPRGILPARGRILHLEAENEQDLLHDWLESLNALHQVHGELYVDFEPRIEGNQLSALVRGEALDPQRHDLGTEVKAVTWHDLALHRTADGYEAYVLLDI